MSRCRMSCRWEITLGRTQSRWSPASHHPMGSSASHPSATRGSRWPLTWTFVSNRLAWLHNYKCHGHHGRHQSLFISFVCFICWLFVKMDRVLVSLLTPVCKPRDWRHCDGPCWPNVRMQAPFRQLINYFLHFLNMYISLTGWPTLSYNKWSFYFGHVCNF